jgi:hypothetical protein
VAWGVLTSVQRSFDSVKLATRLCGRKWNRDEVSECFSCASGSGSEVVRHTD